MRCDNVESVLTYLHRQGCIGARVPLIKISLERMPQQTSELTKKCYKNQFKCNYIQVAILAILRCCFYIDFVGCSFYVGFSLLFIYFKITIRRNGSDKAQISQID